MATSLSDVMQQRKSFVLSAEEAYHSDSRIKLINMLMPQENRLPTRVWSAPSRSPTKTPSMSLLLMRSNFSIAEGEGMCQIKLSVLSLACCLSLGYFG
jgi:hypothetical protein